MFYLYNNMGEKNNLNINIVQNIMYKINLFEEKK